MSWITILSAAGLTARIYHFCRMDRWRASVSTGNYPIRESLLVTFLYQFSQWKPVEVSGNLGQGLGHDIDDLLHTYLFSTSYPQSFRCLPHTSITHNFKLALPNQLGCASALPPSTFLTSTPQVTTYYTFHLPLARNRVR